MRPRPWGPDWRGGPSAPGVILVSLALVLASPSPLGVAVLSALWMTAMFDYWSEHGRAWRSRQRLALPGRPCGWGPSPRAFPPFGWWLATRVGLQRVGDHEASWGYTIRGLGEAQAAIGLTLLKRL